MGNNRDHSPRELRSWARRTSFHPSAFFSGESTVSNSSFASSTAPQAPPPPPLPPSRRPLRPPEPEAEDDTDPAPPLDLERRRGGGRTRRRIDLRGELEIPAAGAGEVLGSAEPDTARGGHGDERRRNGVERLPGEREAVNGGRSGNGVYADTDARKKAEEAEAKRKAEEAEARRKKEEERDAELAAYYQEQWANEEEGVGDGVPCEATPVYRESGLRCGVTENPGVVSTASIIYMDMTKDQLCVEVSSYQLGGENSSAGDHSVQC